VALSTSVSVTHLVSRACGSCESGRHPCGFIWRRCPGRKNRAPTRSKLAAASLSHETAEAPGVGRRHRERYFVAAASRAREAKSSAGSSPPAAPKSRCGSRSPIVSRRAASMRAQVQPSRACILARGAIAAVHRWRSSRSATVRTTGAVTGRTSRRVTQRRAKHGSRATENATPGSLQCREERRRPARARARISH